jgi:pyridoxal phosphate enzyme (YggS family)
VDPPRCHFVGGLQSNKARDAVQLFDVIQSVDRPSLARELSRRAEARGRPLSVLLQVDLAGEARKGGVAETDLPALLDRCAALPGLSVDGLMTLPPAAGDPEASRPFFARLRALRDSLRESAVGAGLRELSMGMSADYQVAIEEGATWVRVGTALFGPRED